MVAAEAPVYYLDPTLHPFQPRSKKDLGARVGI